MDSADESPASPRSKAGTAVVNAGMTPDEIPPSEIRRVLVMDDDEFVCTCLGLLITSMGYRVLLTKDSHAAIALYQQALSCGKPVDVVILDLHLPSGLSGKETLQKLLSLDPGVQAVVSSGDISDSCMSDFRTHGFKYALPKPVSHDELSAVLCALAPLER